MVKCIIWKDNATVVKAVELPYKKITLEGFMRKIRRLLGNRRLSRIFFKKVENLCEERRL